MAQTTPIAARPPTTGAALLPAVAASADATSMTIVVRMLASSGSLWWRSRTARAPRICSRVTAATSSDGAKRIISRFASPAFDSSSFVSDSGKRTPDDGLKNNVPRKDGNFQLRLGR